MINEILISYIESCILPQYSGNDAGHRQDHIIEVINNSIEIVDELNLDVNRNMVFVVAAYHDIGLQFGRATHHITSATILREDVTIAELFSTDEINIMAEAIEDHRASGTNEPRSIYGKIVSEADRIIDLKKIVKRTVAYGLNANPGYTTEEHVNEAYRHIKAKYAEGGYMKLHLNTKRNVDALDKVRSVINEEESLKSMIREFL